MPRKYLRITEVTKICGVNVKFVKRLEQEQVISPIVRGSEKYAVRPAFLPGPEFGELIAKEDADLARLMQLIGLKK